MLSVVSVCLPGPNVSPNCAQVHELHDLRLADDQLRAVLDGLVLVREAVRQRVARVIGPLDDVDQLALDEVHDAHAWLLSAAESAYLRDSSAFLQREGSPDRRRENLLHRSGVRRYDVRTTVQAASASQRGSLQVQNRCRHGGVSASPRARGPAVAVSCSGFRRPGWRYSDAGSPRKTYVVDTSILVSAPDAIQNLTTNNTVARAVPGAPGARPEAHLGQRRRLHRAQHGQVPRRAAGRGVDRPDPRRASR